MNSKINLSVMKRPIAATAGLLALCSTTVQAADVMSLTQDCEVALALSAAPASVQEGAAVYILGEDGFEMVRESTNGYTCFVERNSYDAVVPQCFGEAGRASNVQVIFDEGEMLRAGASFEELREHRVNAVKTKKYPTAGYGLAYMISEFNYIWNRGRMLHIAPHVMFHAPDVMDEEMAISKRDAVYNRGLPIINEPGRYGVMVVFTEYGSDPSAVQAACAGQLPDEANMIRFGAQQN